MEMVQFEEVAKMKTELKSMSDGDEKHFHRVKGDYQDYQTVRRVNEGFLLFGWRWDPGEVDLGYFKVSAHRHIPFLSLSEVMDRLGPAVLLSQKELESALGGFMIQEIEFGPEDSEMGLI